MNEKIEINGEDIKYTSAVRTYGYDAVIEVHLVNGDIVRLTPATLTDMMSMFNFSATKSRKYFYIDDVITP